MKKITYIVFMCVLIITFSLTTFSTNIALASTPIGYTLVKTETEILYYDPNSKNNEVAFVLALAAFVPGLAAYKSADIAMKVMGFGLAWSTLAGQNTKNEFKVTKYIYKNKVTTNNYWGYYYIVVENLTNGQKTNSRIYPIAKMQ